MNKDQTPDLDPDSMRSVLSDHSLFDITEDECTETVDIICSLWDRYLLKFDSVKASQQLLIIVLLFYI